MAKVNLKTLINIFILIIFLVILIFYSFRIINRPHVDPLFFTGFFLFWYFMRKFLILAIKSIMQKYYLFFPKKSLENSKVAKMISFIKIYFISDFIDGFLARFYFVNIIFYKIMKVMCYFYFLPYVLFFFIFVYLPWIMYLFMFLYEILIEQNLLISLYLLFFSFVIRKILSFSLWITSYKLNLLRHSNFNKYFPHIKSEDKSLFAYNTDNLNDVMYKVYNEDKDEVIFIWEGISVVSFLQNRINVTTIFSMFLSEIERFMLNFNILLFFFIFIYLIFDQTLYLNTFIFVTILILLVFVIAFLPYRIEDKTVHVLNNLFILASWFDNARDFIIQNYTCKPKEKDLKHYEFSSCTDLVSQEYISKENQRS